MKRTIETTEGKLIEVYPIETRVRSKDHPELTGVIRQLEFHESGKISPIPYCISWDDNSKAYDLLGWMFIYSDPESIEIIK